MTANDDPLLGLRPAAPPAALRDRVLRAARSSAASRPEHGVTRLDLETLWSAALLLTLLGHLAVGLLAGAEPRVVFPRGGPAVAQRMVTFELAFEASQGRASEDSQ